MNDDKLKDMITIRMFMDLKTDEEYTGYKYDNGIIKMRYIPSIMEDPLITNVKLTTGVVSVAEVCDILTMITNDFKNYVNEVNKDDL